MRKTILGSLTSLLIPFAAYGAHTSYGAYQRKSLARATSGMLAPSNPLPLWQIKSPEEIPADALFIHNGTAVRELVIVDANVQDKHLILKQAKSGVDIVEIKIADNGVAALIQALEGYKNLHAVHIVAHAEAGVMYLGGHQIDKQTLMENIPGFAAINQALREGGDLLLYGCDLAMGAAGEDFLEILQQNTHADIAASLDKTGNEAFGGNWELEIQTGDIEAQPLPDSIALKDFSTVLAAPAGVKNFSSGWTDNGNTLVSTHFIVGAKDANSTNPLDAAIYAAPPNPAYIQNGESLNSYFYVNADGVDTGTFELTGLTSGEYLSGQFTDVYIVGVLLDNSTITSSTINGTGTSYESFNFGASELSNFSGVQLKGFKLYFDANVLGSVPFFEFRSFTTGTAQNPADSDGTLTAGAGVSEPVGLATTVDTVGEAVNVFDFNIADGGTNDSYNLTVSELFINVSGTSTDTERGQITWRLNGPDASNVTGTYSAATDRITFSSLSIDVANGGNETYTVNAYFNNNTGLTEDRTIILSVDGDTNLTVGALGTQMGSTIAVNNGTGTTIDVTATQLVFTTQPAGSVSGSALTTQPVVAARDAFGNTDVDFTETITLTEASAGSLSNNTQAATSGVATFTNLIYTATADQESFTLTANDQDGVGSNLPTVNANAVTSDVVATKLVFTTQPAPTTLNSGVPTSFTTVPVVRARDANDLDDTGYATGIVLSVTDPNDGTVDGTVNSLTGTGDADGAGTTVTLTPSSGVATYTGLQLTYTVGGVLDTIALRSTSGGLTAANSTNISAVSTPVVTDGNISISGASGTGGAFKIGDTVTATWNNTAGGDNNTGVSGVTVDFSQFGGGAAVAASESSGTWTATYTIVAGAIDATNRNVSVTATNGVGPTTTADTTNATVDNIAPTITDTNISISGATGTGGVYKIGDTVTATWNNTAGGDNNSDTISSVTVDFTQFGGGAAVAATNSAGTWTATYTVVAGAIDGTNRNVSVTAADNAGNTTTAADTTNASVDNAAPTVTDANISISGGSGTGGAYIAGDTVTATWNNTAGGDNNSDTISSVTVDFTQFGGGAAVAATNSAGTWTATYTIGAGVDASNRNVSVSATDNAGNSTTTADTTNAAVDSVAPTVTDGNISISGASGTGGAYKIGDTITATWNNTAGGDNNGDIVSASVNFSSFGGGAAVAATNNAGTWTATHTLVAGAIDAANRNVSVAAFDDAGNNDTTADTTNATVDNIAPTVTDANISISGASGPGGVYVIGDTVTATWNNTAGGDNNSDTISGVIVNFTQFGGGAAVAATNSAGTWTATYTIVAGAIDATNRNVSVTAADNAGNTTTTADTTNASVDNAAPTVTDGNISIFGASGIGGAYIIGDTITATWNNTAAGDNNGDIASVTVDFTAFGGGAAVAATNSAGTWTATHTLVAGAIDGTNLNISVTATDNADNTTAMPDTTNATVDTVAPTVTDANISISGATGTGGAFKIGDTVTATWNDTAGGDNNSDTISGVTVDFSQFGGGAAVAASNSSDTWTATYTIISGAIDGSNRNVGVTATDNAGNSAIAADTSNATVDNVAPTVTNANISISGASGTGGAFKIGDTVTATWNDTAGGDNNSDTISGVTVDFSQFGGGAAVAASNSSDTWTATYTIVSGAIDGTNRNVSVTATDNAGNGTTTADTTNATVDNAAPTVTDARISISGASGTGGAFRIGDTVTATWNNTAGGDNNGDIASVTADFTQFGGGAAVAASNSSDTWTATYTIVSGAIDGTNRNVSVTATDNAGNVTTTADTTNATVDNVAPNVTDANISISGATGAGGIYIAGDTITATWNDTAGGDNNSDTISSVTVNFTAFGGGAAVAAINSADTWTATHTITPGPIDGTNRNVSVTATDNAGNGTTRADTSNATVDTQGPSVDSVILPANGSYRAGQNLNFTVNYDEAVTVNTGGGTPRLELTVGATTRYATYTSGSGTAALLFRYTVQAGDTDSDGIALNATLQTNGGTIRDGIGNNAATALGAIGSLASVLVDTQTPSIDSVTLPADATYLLGQNLDFTVNYDENVTVNTAGGTPRLALTIGAAARFAGYVSGSGTGALLFRYTVQSGDSDGDGIVLNPVLDNNGGTTRDAAGNDAETNLGANDLSGVLVDALDTDGDGVSDVQEGIDGTDPNDPDDYLDVTDPVITAPLDLPLDATELYTPVTLKQLLGLPASATDNQVQAALDALATDNIDGNNCCNPTVFTVASNGGAAQPASNNTLRLAPGNHVVTWRATDRKGNTDTDTQTVQIEPLVSVSKDQTGVEGASVAFRVFLNGPAVTYPFDAPYVIDMINSTAGGTDHDLIDGNVTFAAGQTEQSLTINLAPDGLGDSGETLVINLDTAINTGVTAQHTITITEDNVAPAVDLGMQQGAGNTALVVTGDGNVTVTANVTDPGDTHTFDWSGTAAQLMDTDGDTADNTFVFDPGLLTPGIYTMHVFVTDSGSATDTARLRFRVVATAPALNALDDTDGDGIDDVTEGYGDSDGDGIPDYRDNIAARNVLPETAAVTDAYLIECDPGVRCRLGHFALLVNDGAQITEDDLPVDEDFNNTGLFDFEAHDLPVAGQTVRVVIPQIEAIPTDAAYRKFDGDQWFTFIEDADNSLHSTAGEAGFCPPPGDAGWEPGLVEGYFCVQLTIEDGGPNDADGLANGSVEDPGGVGAPVAAPPPPNGGSSSSSSSGGTTTTWSITGKTQGGGGALNLPAGLALLLLVLLRNRRRAAGLCALVAALFAPSSQAQNEVEHYLTFSLYQAENDQTRGDFINGMAADGVPVVMQDYDVSRSAYQLSAGLRYRPNMAIEFGYLDLGEVNFALTADAANAAAVSNALSRHQPVSGDGWVLSHRFDHVFAGQWRASADLGVYFWNGDTVIEDPRIHADIKDGIDPLLGLQVAYPLPGEFELGLQYRRIFLDDQNVELWGGALSWNF